MDRATRLNLGIERVPKGRLIASSLSKANWFRRAALLEPKDRGTSQKTKVDCQDFRREASVSRLNKYTPDGPPAGGHRLTTNRSNRAKGDNGHATTATNNHSRSRGGILSVRLWFPPPPPPPGSRASLIGPFPYRQPWTDLSKQNHASGNGGTDSYSRPPLLRSPALPGSLQLGALAVRGALRLRQAAIGSGYYGPGTDSTAGRISEPGIRIL